MSLVRDWLALEKQPHVAIPFSQLPDHELFSISLETLLSTHFMYGDPEWHTRCVASARTSNMLGETQDENRRHKKFSGYVVYVAYRLGAYDLNGPGLHMGTKHSRKMLRYSGLVEYSAF